MFSFSEKCRDGILLFDRDDIFFFSGFRSSNALFLITPTESIFFTDARYFLAAQNFFMEKGIAVQDFSVLKKGYFSEKKIGIDLQKLPVSRWRQWKKKWGGHFSNVSLAKERAKKSSANIRALEKAADIADVALKKILPFLKEGISEKQLAWILEKAGRELGAEKVSFDTIVAFGTHSAVPHHSPTEKKLTPNMPILIDWGFVADGFCSDCTRCFFYGSATEKWKKTYTALLRAQKMGREKMRVGEKISAVQECAETVLETKIPHSFGHGVGVQVHEFPTISPKTTGRFEKNMAVTAEPGQYFPGAFGIRIEDLLLVEESGARSLTRCEKEMEKMIFPSS